MKTKSSLCLLLFTFSFLLSPCTGQIPQGFNYQAIARDAGGAVLPNTSLQVMLYIQSSSSGGTIFWKELHSSVNTNAFGLFNLVVGTGTRQSESTIATFDLIDWSVIPKYLKTEIYYSSSWKDMGTTQLYSVPYSMRSKESDQWMTSGTNIYRTLGNVGVGTSSPTNRLQIGSSAGPSGTGTTTPNSLSLGDDFGTNTIGTNFKLKLFDVSNLSATYGLGISSYLLEMTSGSGGAIGFFTNSGFERMRITSGGNIGIGLSSPEEKLDINGILSLRQAAGGTASKRWQVFYNANDAADYGLIFVKVSDGRNYLSLGTGGINFCPAIFRINASGPSLQFEGDHNYIEWFPSGMTPRKAVMGFLGAGSTHFALSNENAGGHISILPGSDGRVGIGTWSPAAAVDIQTSASWADDIPLFEVKNKSGIPVFAVYNNGVRILVDHTISKAVKGGFAVGGYDLTKAGKTVDFMTISPDSIRFNINNDNVKALKGGFAVGGYDATKGTINQDFMYLTPQNSENGKFNTFIGYKSGTNTGGSLVYSNYNTFLGYQAGYLNTYGYSNVFIGYNAGYSNIGNSTGSSGFNNVYIGQLAGEKNNGTNNVFIGDEAGKTLTSGIRNVYIGSSAGVQSTGNYNTYIGANAGKFDTGSDNVCIGYGSGFGSSESGYLAIGNRTNSALISGSFSSSKLYLWADVGIGASTLAGYKLYVSGAAYSTGGWATSDIRYKKDITDMSMVLSELTRLNPVNFVWRKDEFPQMNFDDGRQIGLIAQEVEEIFPDLVRTDDNGYKAVSYEKLSVLLLEGIKEQQKQIDELKTMVEKLASGK